MSDRYEIREQIGKGGLGAVYKAFDTQLQREVAIKRVLTPGEATDEEVQDAADKLIGEAQTLSSLNHPNIITVFDVAQDDKGGFVVMELLKGETLDETIERGVLTQEDFTEVVYQTMEALIAAQAADVIHRDIKPTNIMVIWQASGKFQLKILDFGLAKFSKTPSVQTMDQEESVLGSIFFMAPEQFERGELDARTDIYQMGCVYYNALTGQYPFNGETAPQVMNAHLQHKVIPLDQIRPDLPPVICQWVMWLINRDIDHRPKDARDALKRWPKDPDPAEIPVAKALPVEETPEVSTGDIKIVTAASQASAPPQLIVTGTAPNAAMGSSTGRLKTGSQSARPELRSRSSVQRGNRKKGGNKIKLIVLGSIVSAIAIGIGIKVANNAKLEEQKDRMIALSSAEDPEGTPTDIETAVLFLADGDTSPSLRSDVIKVLENLDGNGIDAKILAELQESESMPLNQVLARILSDRGYTEALPAIVNKFRAATSDDQRVTLLNAIRGLASMDDIDEILGALGGEHSRDVRVVFEDTILAVLRKSENPDPVIDDLLTRVSSAETNLRKSYFRILGVMGGDSVRTRLTSIYNKKNDLDYQRDAINGYYHWQDRSVLPDLEKIIEETDDSALRPVAASAYARVAILPGPEPLAEKLKFWDKAWNLATNPNDARRLVGAAIEHPSQETLAMLRKWSAHETFGTFAKGAIGTMQKSITSIPEIASGDELKGNRARVQGDSRAAINSFLESLTGWVSPDTWFTWNFKVKEAGDYAIELDQASVRDETSQFLIHLAGKTFAGESLKTDSLEEFETVKLDGTVTLEAGRPYTLELQAGKRVQPRMMDIGAIRLVKQGGKPAAEGAPGNDQ